MTESAKNVDARRGYDAFVSYSSDDRDVANEIVSRLEAGGVRCWIAPRDIAAGQDWSAAIPPAIDLCPAFVLILSERSNDSPQVVREVHIAQAAPSKLVVPFRIADVQPKGALRYLLSGLHWLDASGADRPAKIDELLERLRDSASGEEYVHPLPSVERKTAPNNLPADANAFVGRESELAGLKSAILERAVVSIVGTGGVGKTRLACRAARESLPDFPDGAWVVELATISDPRLVVSSVVETLGVAEASGDDRFQTLAGHFASKRALLVLDNCEQVLDACARLAGRIARSCPNVRVICTSRSPLAIPEEFVLRVNPLAPPAQDAPSVSELDASPAASLFLQRAASIAPVTLESAQARAAVAAICRRLDGLPLALELAAARTNVLSVEQIAASVDKRFKLLTGGSRTAEPRQQTLAGLIAWSYDLLDEDERMVLRRIAVFRGGSTLETATAVCASESMDEWRVLDVLASLADKSLLAVESDGARKRYGQLESIREYGREKLNEASELRDVENRHAAVYAAIARAAYDEWDAAPRPDWLARLSPDLDNFRASLAFDAAGGGDEARGAQTAADLGPVFLRMSLLREGIEWCERALTTSPPPAIAARLNYGLSSLRYNRGEAAEALAAAQRAAELYAGTTDRRGLTRALSQVAHLAARRRLTAEAQAAAEAAIVQARLLGDDRLLAGVLQRCAAALDDSEIDRARELFGECVSLFRLLGRNDETARAIVWWAAAESNAGCYARARDLSIEALPLLGNDVAEMNVRGNIAFFCLASGDETGAKRYARDALDLAAKKQSPLMIAIPISYIAVMLHETDPALGARLLGFSEARLAALDWKEPPATEKIHRDLQRPLSENFSQEQFAALVAEGAALSEDEAVARALAAI
jgi:non-specific serine/threonine protein kinase